MLNKNVKLTSKHPDDDKIINEYPEDDKTINE